MKSRIFYFSGTGNSLAAARRIAAALGEAEVLPLAAQAGAPDLSGVERAGVVFPACMWGPPLLVKDFLKRFSTGAYTFLVCTNGGDVAGVLAKAAKYLRSAGTVPSCGFSVRMPSNYTPWGIAPAEERKKILEEAHERLDRLAAEIREGKVSPVERGPLLRRFVLTDLLWPLASSGAHGMDDFLADPECNGCGSCAKVCPVENIVLENGRPRWLHKCQQCFACLHACPKEAIQKGKGGKKTRGVERYRHPEVCLKDLMKRS